MNRFTNLYDPSGRHFGHKQETLIIGTEFLYKTVYGILLRQKHRCSAKEYGGKPRILQAFIPTCEGNKTLAKQWLESDCYQLANRLAFIHFCKTNGINAKLCLISFLNGNKRSRKEVHNTETWDKVWEEEYSTLSLTKTQRDDILRVYIECNNG